MGLTRVQLEQLCAIAVDAGREIMDAYAGDIVSWAKPDASPLSEADLRADRLIRSRLESEFPGVFILSEESVSACPINAPETFFLVDPLDGTKEFLARNGEFTVNIALIEGGKPVAGVVFAPASNELYFAAHAMGAFKRTARGDEALHTASAPGVGRLRIIGSRSHASEALASWLRALEQPYRLVVAGSSLKFCRIAEGAADVYPRFGPTSQWDTASAQAVLEEAGGAVIDAQGRPLRYGLRRNVLNPNFVAVGHPGLTYPPLP